jgi:hypothetical protein
MAVAVDERNVLREIEELFAGQGPATAIVEIEVPARGSR